MRRISTSTLAVLTVVGLCGIAQPATAEPVRQDSHVKISQNSAYAPASAPTGAAPGPAEAPATTATAPKRVEGYTPHCRERMADRGISEFKVRQTVMLNWSRAVRQSHGTWRYTSRHARSLVVILNDNGYCVTTYRPSVSAEGEGSASILGRSNQVRSAAVTSATEFSR